MTAVDPSAGNHLFCQRTDFCERCGCALADAVDGRGGECMPPGVVALTAARARRWQDALTGKIMALWGAR